MRIRGDRGDQLIESYECLYLTPVDGWVGSLVILFLSFFSLFVHSLERCVSNGNMRERKFSRLAKRLEGKSVTRYITGNAKSR